MIKLSKLKKTYLPFFYQPFSLTGTPALTSQQFKEADFEKIVEFIDEGIQIKLDVKKKTGECSDKPDDGKVHRQLPFF